MTPSKEAMPFMCAACGHSAGKHNQRGCNQQIEKGYCDCLIEFGMVRMPMRAELGMRLKEIADLKDSLAKAEAKSAKWEAVARRLHAALVGFRFYRIPQPLDSPDGSMRYRAMWEPEKKLIDLSSLELQAEVEK